MIKKIWPSLVKINSFRNFHDVSFELGRQITLISGQNGSGKSNLLSLIASASGLSKKSELGSNFQPDFNDFFWITSSEDFNSYQLFVDFSNDDGKPVVRKKLTFKDDTQRNRGIRIIPRTVKILPNDNRTLKAVEAEAHKFFGVGGAARVPIPTIYLSLSRLYPLGENKSTIKIRHLASRNTLYKKKADQYFAEWYNAVIPNSIIEGANLSIIEKKEISRRNSFHMTMNNIPAVSQSVGQDNLGNIISALVDVYLLSLQGGYKGALICIDEIDVSLHPDSQIRLLNLMFALASELNIQFVVTSHSLTIIKELSSKAARYPRDYKIVYLKNPSSPFVAKDTDYYTLKADLFNQLSYKAPLTKVYFEDDVGKKLFLMLLEAIEYQIDGEDGTVKAQLKIKDAGDKRLLDNIDNLKILRGIEDKLNLISTQIGCEELIRITGIDPYFKRVIFLLDGDARIKNGNKEDKPQIKDYLDKSYEPNSNKNRKNISNVCYFPDYFAPESFLYKIIYDLTSNQLDYALFWRSLDQFEETKMYTRDKILEQVKSVGTDFDNEKLKKLFKKTLWDFCDKTHPLKYYYNNKQKLPDLIKFWNDFLKIYKVAKNLTLQNRYD